MSCKSVLVVEDDVDIRESLEQILQLEGFHPVLAENGQVAVNILEALELDGERPCLILLDLMMPVMSGWEFLQVQKERGALATIPVVVVSAAGDRARVDLADGFIKKPIELERLLSEVRRYCGAMPSGQLTI